MKKDKVERMRQFFDDMRAMNDKEFAEFLEMISRPIEKPKKKTVWDRISNYTLDTAVEIARDGYNVAIVVNDNKSIFYIVETIQYICDRVYAFDMYDEIEIDGNEVKIKETDIVIKVFGCNHFSEDDANKFDWVIVDGMGVSDRCRDILKNHEQDSYSKL